MTSSPPPVDVESVLDALRKGSGSAEDDSLRGFSHFGSRSKAVAAALAPSSRATPEAPSMDDSARTLADSLGLPVLEETDGRTLAISDAARRVLGSSFPGSLVEAAICLHPEDSPEGIALALAYAPGDPRGVAIETPWIVMRSPTGRRRIVRVPNRLKNEFDIRANSLAASTHELSNALTAISCLARRALDGHGSQDAVAALRGIVAVCDGAVDVVRHFRASVPTTTTVRASEPTDVSDVLRGLHATLLPMAEEKGIKLDPRIEDDIIFPVDATELRTIAWNLVKNAVEAVPRGGKVSIAAGMREGRFRLVVADNGPGMDAETLARVQQPFVSGRPEGTGLGLSIVKDLVGRRGGELNFDTRLGSGTRVVVFLPCPEEAARRNSSGVVARGSARESGKSGARLPSQRARTKR